MKINFKGVVYVLKSNDDSLSVKAIDTRSPNEKDETLKNYDLALKFKGNMMNTIKSVRLNGEKLDVLRANSLYGIRENKGGLISVDINKKYKCLIFDPVYDKVTNTMNEIGGDLVEIVNVMPYRSLEEYDIDIVNLDNELPLSTEEKERLSVTVSYEDDMNTAYISFLMPDYPVMIRHEYKEVIKKKVNVDVSGIADVIFEKPRKFSLIKSNGNVYYFFQGPAYLSEEAEISVELLLKERIKVDLYLNQDVCLSDPIVNKEQYEDEQYYRYIYENIKVEDVVSLVFEKRN